MGAGNFSAVKLRRGGSPGQLRGPPWLLALGVALVSLVISCAGAARKPVVEAPAEAPRPRNAAAIAQEVAGGKVSVLVYADRTRGHPIAARLAGLDLWGPVLDGTGIDPQKDLSRAFVSAPSVRAGRDAVVVLEHTLTSDRLKAGLDALAACSEPPGGPLEGLGVPALRVTLRGHALVVATVEPSFLVVLPEAKAGEAKRFVGTGGFADPKGPEAAVATALDPARTLAAPHAPKVPSTVSALAALVTLAGDGGADIAIDGPSASAEQARTDADELSAAVERATTLRVAIVKIRVFDPIKFTAEGERVTATRHVSPQEIDRLFALLSAVIPR